MLITLTPPPTKSCRNMSPLTYRRLASSQHDHDAASGKWFRYDAPDKRLFKQLQKTLTASSD